MHDVLHKFPTTPHLAWLGRESIRDDKVFSPAEVRSFLSCAVAVEEKVDGANLGLSFKQGGQMCFQNRGNWLEGKLAGQWERLRSWALEHEAELHNVLPADHVLFGEWCYARHSVDYGRLPDWFLVFDVYDPVLGKFWSTDRRNSLAAAANLSVVPAVAHGTFKLSELKAMLDDRSELGIDRREGLYLRREDDMWLVSRAKLVRPGFTQAISEHWSRKIINLNSVRHATPH